MLEIDADKADQRHPLATFTQIAWELMQATGENVRVIYRTRPVVLEYTGDAKLDGRAGSKAWSEWHEGATEFFRDQVRRELGQSIEP